MTLTVVGPASLETFVQLSDLHLDCKQHTNNVSGRLSTRLPSGGQQTTRGSP